MVRKCVDRIRWKSRMHERRRRASYVYGGNMRRKGIKGNQLRDVYSSNDNLEDAQQEATNALEQTVLANSDIMMHSAKKKLKRTIRSIREKKMDGAELDHKGRADDERKKLKQVHGVYGGRACYSRENNGKRLEITKRCWPKIKHGKAMRASAWKAERSVLGGGVCICIMVMVMLGMLLASPFSILFHDESENGEGMTLEQGMEIAESEFVSDAEAQMHDLEVDSVLICSNDGGLKIENWNEIIAVFAVRCGMGHRIIIDEERLELLEDTIYDMVCLKIAW